MPASAGTASKASVNWPARSRMRTLNWSARSPRSMSRFLACWGPWPVRVGGHAEDVHVPAADLQHEEHVQALQCEGTVDVEEVAGEHRGGMDGQEPAPGGVVVARRCRWDA